MARLSALGTAGAYTSDHSRMGWDATRMRGHATAPRLTGWSPGHRPTCPRQRMRWMMTRLLGLAAASALSGR